MNWLTNLIEKFGGKSKDSSEPDPLEEVKKMETADEAKQRKRELRSRVASIDVSEMDFDDALAVYDFITELMQEDRGRNYITQNDLVLSFYWIDKAFKKYIACIAWDKFGDEKMMAQLGEIAAGFDSIWLTMLTLYVPDEFLGDWLIMPDGKRSKNPMYIKPFEHDASYETNKDYLSFCLRKAESCPEFDYKIFTRSRAMGLHLKYQAEDELKQAEEAEAKQADKGNA